jgi:alkyl hydroperoxide reductase subunit AhpC
MYVWECMRVEKLICYKTRLLCWFVYFFFFLDFSRATELFALPYRVDSHAKVESNITGISFRGNRALNFCDTSAAIGWMT